MSPSIFGCHELIEQGIWLNTAASKTHTLYGKFKWDGVQHQVVKSRGFLYYKLLTLTTFTQCVQSPMAPSQCLQPGWLRNWTQLAPDRPRRWGVVPALRCLLSLCNSSAVGVAAAAATTTPVAARWASIHRLSSQVLYHEGKELFASLDQLASSMCTPFCNHLSTAEPATSARLPHLPQRKRFLVFQCGMITHHGA